MRGRGLPSRVSSDSQENPLGQKDYPAVPFAVKEPPGEATGRA